MKFLHVFEGLVKDPWIWLSTWQVGFGFGMNPHDIADLAIKFAFGFPGAVLLGVKAFILIQREFIKKEKKDEDL